MLDVLSLNSPLNILSKTGECFASDSLLAPMVVSSENLKITSVSGV